MEILLNVRLKELVDDGKGEEFCNKLGIDSSIYYKWRDGSTLPTVQNAVKLAEYFGFSLDFLLGLTEDDRRLVFNPCQNFAVRLKLVMKEKNTNPFRLSKKAHISRTSIYEWLNEVKIPTIPSIVNLAVALDCSTDYLLGRE